jgi:prepilin-type N-terminal cleavage/methylation domain-containing protein
VGEVDRQSPCGPSAALTRLRRLAAAGERRLHASDGFTLIELLTVMVIIAVLIATTYPTYLGYKERANRSTAQANLREAVPAVEAFYHENQTYDTSVMTVAAIRSFDLGLSPDFEIVSGSDTTYCVKATHGGMVYYKDGPGSNISAAPCT